MYFFSGLMDEIMVADYAKSADEIWETYAGFVGDKDAPLPTGRSMILASDADPRNVLAAIPARVPLLVVGSDGTVTPEAQSFIDEYEPDAIYTIGFSAGLDNSYVISRSRVAGLFFPNATQAVLANGSGLMDGTGRAEAIIASSMAYYLGVPVLFDRHGWPDGLGMIDLENMSTREVQEFYVGALSERNDSTSYLVVTNTNTPASLLAGRLAGLRKGYVVPVSYAAAALPGENEADTRREINEAMARLRSQGMYAASLDYMKGEPLYLALLGGVAFANIDLYGQTWIDGLGSIFTYSDAYYSDADGDGSPDLAVGRLDGSPASVSLQLERQFLPKDESAVFLGLYRQPRMLDVKTMGSGVTQAWTANLFAEMAGMDARNSVERRTQKIVSLDDVPGFGGQLNDCVENFNMSLGGAGYGPACLYKLAMDTLDKVMYSVVEFDWWEWFRDMETQKPRHFQPLENTSAEFVGNAKVLGYFGLRSLAGGWLVPPAAWEDEYAYWQLLLAPYMGSGEITAVDYGNFLYEDVDYSYGSGIARSVLDRGGQALVTTGPLYEPFELYTSDAFFLRAMSGQTVGESLRCVMATNPVVLEAEDMAYGGLYLCLFDHDPVMCPVQGIAAALLRKGNVRDRVQRILLGDPAYGLTRKAVTQAGRYSIGLGNSFLWESSITGAYNVTADGLEIYGYDDWLAEEGEPAVQLFVREVTLPEGASLAWVNVTAEYTAYGGLDVSAVPEEINFTEAVLGCANGLGLAVGQQLTEAEEAAMDECILGAINAGFEGPWPDRGFWWTRETLLDGRTAVRIFVPAVIYANRTSAEVLDEALLQVDYETPLELTVRVGDVPLGRDAVISVDVMNMGGAAEGTLHVWVEGPDGSEEEYTRSMLAGANSTQRMEFDFAPSMEGVHLVTSVWESSLPVGPRRASFRAEASAAIPEIGIPSPVAAGPGETAVAEIVVANVGTEALRMNVSAAPLSWFDPVLGRNASMDATDGYVEVEAGGNGTARVEIAVPDGWPAGTYEMHVAFQGDGRSLPESVVVPAVVEVARRAYWSAGPDGVACTLPGRCEAGIWASSSLRSNSLLNVTASLTGLTGLAALSGDGLSVERAGNGSLMLVIENGGRMRSGSYMGSVALAAPGGSVPPESAIPVGVDVRGPELGVSKSYVPGYVLLWNGRVMQSSVWVGLEITNAGSEPISEVAIRDALPPGWGVKKGSAVAYVVRQGHGKRIVWLGKRAASASGGWAYLNVTLPKMEKGDRLEVMYAIGAEDPAAGAYDMAAVVEAESPTGIYSQSSATSRLEVRPFSPPGWFRLFFWRLFNA
jgi:hypothetical protein